MPLGPEGDIIALMESSEVAPKRGPYKKTAAVI